MSCPLLHHLAEAFPERQLAEEYNLGGTGPESEPGLTWGFPTTRALRPAGKHSTRKPHLA